MQDVPAIRVAKYVLTLESRLGTALFHRLGKSMIPTSAGLRLLDVARETLARLRAAEEDVGLMAKGRAAVLRLSTECYTCYHWLPPLLGRFMARFPGVDVQIIAEATFQTSDALLDGRIDLGIVHDEARSDQLMALSLFEDELLVVMSPGHPLAAKPFVGAEDLREEHLFDHSLPLSRTLMWRTVLSPAGVTPRRVSKVQLTEAIVELTRSGLGIAVLARWAVAPHLASGALVGRPLTAAGLRRQWYALMLRQESLPLHVREFVHLLAAGPSALTNSDRAMA